ncbi:hypothetical protein EC973_009286 [Apophysomyces ossiformis]|uniref:N-terminal Ras-GEF domain-containing protein n=1 Tax=Apophysomyces ossiformis TaxID=679940 RepID=A0A8H7BUQ4_9FUNG|nr:hypothetical protein EC973_009286 [Apophysomyces ossiformis]
MKSSKSANTFKLLFGGRKDGYRAKPGSKARSIKDFFNFSTYSKDTTSSKLAKPKSQEHFANDSVISLTDTLEIRELTVEKVAASPTINLSPVMRNIPSKKVDTLANAGTIPASRSAKYRKRTSVQTLVSPFGRNIDIRMTDEDSSHYVVSLPSPIETGATRSDGNHKEMSCAWIQATVSSLPSPPPSAPPTLFNHHQCRLDDEENPEYIMHDGFMMPSNANMQTKPSVPENQIVMPFTFYPSIIQSLDDQDSDTEEKKSRIFNESIHDVTKSHALAAGLPLRLARSTHILSCSKAHDNENKCVSPSLVSIYAEHAEPTFIRARMGSDQKQGERDSQQFLTVRNIAPVMKHHKSESDLGRFKGPILSPATPNKDLRRANSRMRLSSMTSSASISTTSLSSILFKPWATNKTSNTSNCYNTRNNEIDEYDARLDSEYTEQSSWNPLRTLRRNQSSVSLNKTATENGLSQAGRNGSSWKKSGGGEGSILHIAEDGYDVLIMEMISGKLQIVAGTSDKLLIKLADETSQDFDYIDTYLMNYSWFSTPVELFEDLMARFHLEALPGEVEYFKKWQRSIQHK